MITPYRHISFDLDGTLVRTLASYRHQLVPDVIQRCGGSADSLSIDRFWFEGNRSEIIANEFQVDPERFWKIFNELDTVERRMPHTSVYDDVIVTIQRIKSLGKTVSIITGSPPWIGEMEIKKLENVTIDHVCFARSEGGYPRKPSPESMHAVLCAVGHVAKETLYIGNGQEDAEFAKAAGCDFVMIDRNEYRFSDRESSPTISSLERLFV